MQGARNSYKPQQQSEQASVSSSRNRTPLTYKAGAPSQRQESPTSSITMGRPVPKEGNLRQNTLPKASSSTTASSRESIATQSVSKPHLDSRELPSEMPSHAFPLVHTPITQQVDSSEVIPHMAVTPQVVEEFTRENAPEDRDGIAATIHEKRHEPDMERREEAGAKSHHIDTLQSPKDVPPAWDPNSSVPPPMTPAYGYPPLIPQVAEWNPNGTTPPPLPDWARNAPPLPSDMPPLLPVEFMPLSPTESAPFDYSQVPPLPSAENIPKTPQGKELQGTGAPLKEHVAETNEGREVLPPLGVLDRGLTSLGLGDGGIYTEKWKPRLAEYINEKKNLPPDSVVDLYHGLNGGLEKALAVLESPDEGVRQISGPCLAIHPVGQFWKPGDAGLKYSIPRKMIEFPGEHNPDAKFRMETDGVVIWLED